MIPKTIHYCWFGGDPLPKSVRKCISSWKKYCHDYTIIEWNEHNFDINSHPFMREAYRQKKWAFVSDYARLKVISDYGGIYLDTDVELLKNLNTLLTYSCYFGIQQCDNRINTGLGFGAEKHHALISSILKKYDDREFNIKNIKNIICPIITTEVLNSEGYFYTGKTIIKDKVCIFEPKFFDPIPFNNIGENLICEDTYSIHHYDATWFSPYQKFRKRLSRMIGIENAKIIKNIFMRNE